jgi:hypothetical protein
MRPLALRRTSLIRFAEGMIENAAVYAIWGHFYPLRQIAVVTKSSIVVQRRDIADEQFRKTGRVAV